MRRKLTWVLAVVVSVVAGALAVTALTPSGDAPATDVPPAVNVDGTVEVVRRDIAAVVSVDGVVVANPHYDVVASKSGTISYVLDRTDGADSQRREPVFRTDPTPSPEPGDDPSSADPGDEPSPDPPTEPAEPGDGTEPEPEWADVPIDAGDVLWRADDGKEVKAPVDGAFVEWLVPDGTKVHKGTPVARLSYAGFAMVGTLPAVDAYRLLDGDLTATGGIPDGPTGFECLLLQAPAAEPTEDDGPTPQIVCAVDDDVRLFVDLYGRIVLDSGLVEDVLVLPVTAVSGGAEQGEVTVVHEDGSTEIKVVKLGATDGAVVEIVDGLEEGDQVSATPPPLVR